MALRLQFRVQQLPVDGDFEATAVGRRQFDLLDYVLVFLEQLFRQTHGPAGVVSDRAVDNFNGKHKAHPII